MKIKFDKRITTILKLLVTSGALYFVFRKIDINELWLIFKSSNLFFLLIAILFFILSKVVSSYRLNYFLRTIRVNITEKFNLQLYWLGMYYNLFLPGGIGGDGYKIYLLNKMTKVKVKPLFWSILLDRITGLLALFCLAVALGYFMPLEMIYKYILWLGIPLSVVAFYIFLRITSKEYLSSFIITNLQSFIVQTAQIISAYFIIKAMGITSNTGSYLFLFLLSSIVATVPFTIGGVGAREITFYIGARFMNLEMEPSIGLGVLFFFITAVVSLFGIYYSFSMPKYQSAGKYQTELKPEKKA